MGVDLNRIGFGISSGTSRNGFGNIVSFPSVPAGNPAEGTILSTLYATTYPVAQGGLELFVGALGNYYASQNCDVNVVADGSGGSYTDWVNATNVVYKTTYIGNDGTAGGNSITTPVGDFTHTSWDSLNYYHDGTGSFSTSPVNLYSAGAGTYIGQDTSGGNLQIAVPSSNGDYQYGTYDGSNYYYDGTGGYYTSLYGVNISVSNGDFIYNDGSFDYYWTVSGTSVGYTT